jgi:hypothetical protein
MASNALALSQQETANSEDVQRYGFIPRGNLPGRCRRMFEPHLPKIIADADDCGSGFA